MSQIYINKIIIPPYFDICNFIYRGNIIKKISNNSTCDKKYNHNAFECQYFHESIDIERSLEVYFIDINKKISMFKVDNNSYTVGKGVTFTIFNDTNGRTVKISNYVYCKSNMSCDIFNCYFKHRVYQLKKK